MAIFGFCQHLGLFFKKNVGVTTLPTCRVLSSPPYIPIEYDEFLAPAGKAVTLRGF
jgi:hypothetical protein